MVKWSRVQLDMIDNVKVVKEKKREIWSLQQYKHEPLHREVQLSAAVKDSMPLWVYK